MKLFINRRFACVVECYEKITYMRCFMFKNHKTEFSLSKFRKKFVREVVEAKRPNMHAVSANAD